MSGEARRATTILLYREKQKEKAVIVPVLMWDGMQRERNRISVCAWRSGRRPAGQTIGRVGGAWHRAHCPYTDIVRERLFTEPKQSKGTDLFTGHLIYGLWPCHGHHLILFDWSLSAGQAPLTASWAKYWLAARIQRQLSTCLLSRMV